MQAELVRNVTPPPSYEESVYFKQLIDQIKTQRRKTPPPSYNSKHIFEYIEKPLVGDTKSIPAIPETSDPKDHEPIHERLERVSSSLLELIETAKKSLITETVDDTNEPDLPLQRHCIHRKKSLERLQSSQTSLARTLDQLNISITQHVITTHYTHHHHHYHYQKRPSIPRKSVVPVWTNMLSQTALVFSLCHHLLSWSKSTSSIASALWLISLLWSKKKLKSLLALFRHP